ncbi:tetratricopeptide repeat protein [Massilia horti]|nr:tetratricopeptide repeat protein [Massilia horti]
MSDTNPLVAQLLQEAVALHQQGKLQAAQALYERILAVAARQFDALHLSGVIARQQGRPERAVELICDALTIDPMHATARCNLGAALQDMGRTQDALASYDLAVQLNPRYALALSNRGNTLRKLGRLEEALASYDRALACRPDYPEAWCNRAITLHDLDRPGDALVSAERALAGRSNNVDAWCARANALQALGRFEEAVQSYDRALAGKGGDAKMWCSRGTALKKLNDLPGALQSYERAIELDASYATAYHYRANTLRALGRSDEAVAAYRQALELGADAQQIGFALAALGVQEVPAASPTGYVKELFDQYADHFDRHLVDVLKYRTPELLGAVLRKCVAPQSMDVLDLGCGTGLFGGHLREYARTLVGVDLSEKMLEKGRERGLYDKLECGDIVQYMEGRTGEFDLVAAADVLVYFGELDQLFAQVHRALRAGGWFCFSIEAVQEGDYRLTAANRYAHSKRYLQRLADAAGFSIIALETGPLRTENEVAVLGNLVVLQAR